MRIRNKLSSVDAIRLTGRIAQRVNRDSRRSERCKDLIILLWKPMSRGDPVIDCRIDFLFCRAEIIEERAGPDGLSVFVDTPATLLTYFHLARCGQPATIETDLAFEWLPIWIVLRMKV